MDYTKLRTEREMALLLALRAERVSERFYTDGSQYFMPNADGVRKTYNLSFLDIKYTQTGELGCVVQLVDVEGIEPDWYCLLSDMQDDDEE